MAKGSLTADDMALIKRYIKDELSTVVDAFDETAMQNFHKVGKTCDGNTRNIFKLQAQMTALKEILIDKGLISRDALFERERRELDRLARMSEPDKELAGGLA